VSVLWDCLRCLPSSQKGGNSTNTMNKHLWTKFCCRAIFVLLFVLGSHTFAYVVACTQTISHNGCIWKWKLLTNSKPARTLSWLAATAGVQNLICHAYTLLWTLSPLSYYSFTCISFKLMWEIGAIFLAASKIELS
jgi:hypothetical protein